MPRTPTPEQIEAKTAELKRDHPDEDIERCRRYAKVICEDSPRDLAGLCRFLRWEEERVREIIREELLAVSPEGSIVPPATPPRQARRRRRSTTRKVIGLC